MDSILALLIGATVSCLVYFLAKIAIGSGQSATPEKTVKPDRADDRDTAAFAVAAPSATSGASPPEPAVAVPAAVKQGTRPPPAPLATIPKCVAFFDVETTGLTEKDRIVTLAGLKLLNTDTLSTGSLQMAYIYLIFDPGRKSHPRAEAIHGYSDWTLRQQDSFGAYAETIEGFFNSADLVVAHNAEFDVGFYEREMERLGRSPISKPIFCTMDGYRRKGFAGSASLSAICERIGVARAATLHGALEDAWLAMRVYLWLNKCGISAPLPPEFAVDPTNLKPVPPLPIGPLPRRRRKKIAAAGGEAAAPVENPSLPPQVLQ